MRILVFDHSSLVHPLSESWEGDIHSSSSSRTVLPFSNLGYFIINVVTVVTLVTVVTEVTELTVVTVVTEVTVVTVVIEVTEVTVATVKGKDGMIARIGWKWTGIGWNRL